MNKGIINCLSLLSCLLFIASCNSTNPDKNPVEVEDNVDPMEFFKVGEDYKSINHIPYWSKYRHLKLP